jgi:hypothetical protein
MRKSFVLILTLVAAGACAPRVSTPTRPSPFTQTPVEAAPPVVAGEPVAQLAIEGFVIERLPPPNAVYGPVFTLKETSGRHAATIEFVTLTAGPMVEFFSGTGCIRPSRIEASTSWESKKGIYPYCVEGLPGVPDAAQIVIAYRDDEGRRGQIVADWRRELPAAP